MKDHERAILEERINYYLAKRNWIADKFACKSCKANLSFRNSTAKTARCPCCTISRPVPNNFTMLVCGGCPVSVVHQKRDKTVKCSECKHINIPTFGRTYGRRNRAATAETESTASSSFNQKPEIIVVEYPDDSVAETVRMVATKRVVEVEQDKTEEAGNKKIRL
ncbi:unnamed protein product [Arabidopsis thaliana]|uniref:(thale cress) hypothetical protein n=1 Tax=Arabidopsis thaliana TaxID=3702 RepID=A0A7G2DWR7_ARATH|nr:unnamed protein product [Arabidopsis thaliana]